MGTAGPVAGFVASFALIVMATIGLRWRGLLSSAHAGVVSTLLTELALPALIFERISRCRIDPHYARATAVIIATEVISGAITYGIGKKILQLRNASLGSFIVGSSFAATSQMGLAMVTMLFGNSPEVVSMATIVTQFAVGLPVNTLGLFIMLRLTRKPDAPRGGHPWRKVFTASPVLALAAALVWNFTHLPTTGPVMDTVYSALAMPAAALPVLAPIAVGLAAARFPVRSFLPVILAALLVQLVLQPLVSLALIPMLSMSTVERTVTALYAGLPATPLSVAFAARYGGDRELASAIVLSTTAASLLTLPLLGWLL